VENVETAAGGNLIGELIRRAKSLAREGVMLQPAFEGDCIVATGLDEDHSEFHVVTIDCSAVSVGRLGRQGVLCVYAEPPALAGEYRPEVEYKVPQGRKAVRLSSTMVSTIPALYDLIAHIPEEWRAKLLEASPAGDQIRSEYSRFHADWSGRHGVHVRAFALVDGWDPYDPAFHELSAADTQRGRPVLVAFLQDGTAAGAVWIADCGTISGGLYMT
jgi:hypothetical protein